MKLEAMPEQDLNTKRIHVSHSVGAVCTMQLDGFERTWKEYVPSYYSADRKWPLVVSLHGGAGPYPMHKFTWQLLAERDGFLVLYPDSLSDKILWNLFTNRTREEGYPDDWHYMEVVLQTVLEKYSIDLDRIYLHGQSYGDVSSLAYLVKYAHLFAAGAPSSGPVDCMAIYNEDGSYQMFPEEPLPMLRSHGMNDLLAPGLLYPEDMTEEQKLECKFYTGVLPNIQLWKDRNGIPKDAVPRIAVDGHWNIMYWDGPEGMDVCQVSIAEQGHNPHADWADKAWSSFLSAYRRENGRVVKGKPIRPFVFTTENVAIADGCDKAYVGGKLVEIGGTARLLCGKDYPKGYLYVPVTFLSAAYGADVKCSEDRMSAEVCWRGRKIQLAAGLNGAVVNDNAIEMLPLCLAMDGQLYIPFGETAHLLTGYVTRDCHGVTYVSPETGDLTQDLAMLIQTLLDPAALTRPEQWVALEKKYYNPQRRW